MSIKSELNKLKETDLWSLMLFVLFKLRDSKEYSALSELAYVLDKSNFLNLCEYFGGCNITIPTINELEILLNGLLLYQYIDIDRLSYEQAIANITLTENLRDVKESYHKIKEVLSTYDIQPRT